MAVASSHMPYGATQTYMLGCSVTVAVVGDCSLRVALDICHNIPRVTITGYEMTRITLINPLKPVATPLIMSSQS